MDNVSFYSSGYIITLDASFGSSFMNEGRKAILKGKGGYGGLGLFVWETPDGFYKICPTLGEETDPLSFCRSKQTEFPT